MEVDKFLGRTCLGPVCKRGHDNGNGFSVRYTGSKNCIACMQASNKKYREKNNPPPNIKKTEYLQEIAFNRRIALENGYPTYMGGICKRKHDHGNGFSKRYTLDRDCTICRRNGKRAGGTRDGTQTLKTEGKPKNESKSKNHSKPKKKQIFLPVVPIHVAPTSKLATIDKNYKEALEDRRKLDAQMRRDMR